MLNINGGIELQPVRPEDAYFRRENFHAPFPEDDRRIREYEKQMISWSMQCSKVLAIVKSIYSSTIITELETVMDAAVLNNGTRANIRAVMIAVRNRWGGYSVAKSDLSRESFRKTPKFTTPSSVTAIIKAMRLEIDQRVMWSDLPNNVDHRFSEAEKKSLLVSLMNAWVELKILHTRLRSPATQAALTYDEMVVELLDAIRPLQEEELMAMQQSTDRCHASTSSSMVAYRKSAGWGRSDQSGGGIRSGHSDTCYNCSKTGVNHRSGECTEPVCSWCVTVWPSVQLPGYHHNSTCPHKPAKVVQSKFGATSRQSNVCRNCKNPSYHHFSKCPFPRVSQLGKRANPFADSQSRAHMASMHDLLIAEREEQEVDEHGWSDEGDDSAPSWQQSRNL